MGYTPVVLGDIRGVKKSTSDAFELALSVIFLSGIQHIADIPRGINSAPEYVKDYLKELPASWDEVQFIDGFPGKYVVIARKAGNKWYVAGINGDKTEKQINMDLSFLKQYKSGQLITDGSDANSFSQTKIKPAKDIRISLRPAGGFVMVFEGI